MGVERTWSGADDSELPSVKVKNEWSYTSSSPYFFIERCLIKNLNWECDSRWSNIVLPYSSYVFRPFHSFSSHFSSIFLFPSALLPNLQSFTVFHSSSRSFTFTDFLFLSIYQSFFSILCVLSFLLLYFDPFLYRSYNTQAN